MPPSDTGAAAPVIAETDPAVTSVAPAVAPASDSGVGAAPDGSADPKAPPAPPADPANILDPAAEPEKSAEPEKAAEPEKPIDPASYEVTLPEGITRDDPLVTAFLEGAAGAKLDAKAVQAVLDTAAPKVIEAMAAPYRAWETLNNEWMAAIKADPDVGGANLTPSVNRVAAFLDRHGSPEVLQALKTTGAINNPAVFKLMNKIATAYEEGGATPAGNSAPQPTGLTAAQRMYPSAAQPNGAAR